MQPSILISQTESNSLKNYKLAGSPWMVLVLAVCGIGSAAIFARIGLAQGMSPVGLATWRLTVSTACLLGWQTAPRRAVAERAVWIKPNVVRVILAGAFMAAHFATWIASLRYISVAESTLLVSTSPLWAGLINLFLPGRQNSANFWAGLGVAAVGAWIVATHGPAWGNPHQAWIGILLALAGAVFIVPYLILSESAQKEIGPRDTITAMFAAAAVALWIVAGLTHTASIPQTWMAWAAVVGMTVFSQLIGHYGLNWSLKHFSPAQVAMSTLLEPVVAAGLSWPIFGETLTLVQGMGGLSILIGVGLSLKTIHKPREAVGS